MEPPSCRRLVYVPVRCKGKYKTICKFCSFISTRPYKILATSEHCIHLQHNSIIYVIRDRTLRTHYMFCMMNHY